MLFVALNAFGGGIYGMLGAPDVPKEWLKDSPFHSYFIPSIVLFLLVGGSCLYAGISVLRDRTYASWYSILCASILVIWILVQVMLIGYVSWLQPTISIIAALIFLMAMRYRKEKSNR